MRVNSFNTRGRMSMEIQNIEALFNKGIEYMEKGEFQEAYKTFSEVIENIPDEPEAYVQRGIALNRLGQFQEAVEDFKTAISLEPEYADAYYHRGEAYYRSNNFPQAIDDLTKAIEIEPNFIEAYRLRALSYISSGKPQRATGDLSVVIEANPQDANLYVMRGQAYVASNIIDQALSDFTYAISINPNYEEAYLLRGTVLETLGDINGATADYRKAIEVNSKSIQGRIALAKVLLQKEEEKEAEKYIKEVLEIDAGGSGAWMAIPFLPKVSPAEEFLDATLNLAISNRAEGIELLYNPLGGAINLIIAGMPMPLTVVDKQYLKLIEDVISSRTQNKVLTHSWQNVNIEGEIGYTVDADGNNKMIIHIKYTDNN